MKDLRPVRGRYYIAELIAQGEHEHQDFKYAVSDAAKIARSLSAFANNDGGRLLIGVKDNGVIAGVRNEEDIYVVEQAAQMYCVPEQEVGFTSFRTDGGLVVVRAEIAKSEQRPVFCRDSLTGCTLRAFYRVADENLEATPLMIKAWKCRSGNLDGFGSGNCIDSTDAALLSLIDNREGLLAEDAARRLHISLERAENAVVKLYCMGVVDFAAIAGRFRVVTL